jgi:hypothetical protein
MAGDACYSCPLPTLQTCCDRYNQPHLAHSYGSQSSHDSEHFHHLVSCTEVCLDETAALNTNCLPTSVISVAEWSEVNMEIISSTDQHTAGYVESTYPCCTPCWPQSTWQPGEIQPGEIQPGEPHSLGACPSLRRRSPNPSPTTSTKQNSQCSKSRKRGRPRQYCDSSNASMPSECSDKAIVRRFVHNKVERKYREGINAEIKRLQRAVPRMQRRAEKDDETLGGFRPSKAMILTGAIDYIKKLERERDAALEELGGRRNE